MSNVGEEEGKVDDIKSEECYYEHGEECNERADELHDRKLFTHPDGSHLGECPLCFLPLPIDRDKYVFWPCCSEIICHGCLYAHCMSNLNDHAKARRCPFCREEADDDSFDKRMMKRIKANDLVALIEMGTKRIAEGDYVTAFEYLTRAAELEGMDAHYHLGYMYALGYGVEKDDGNAVYHWEKAAIGGHPMARHRLACADERNGNQERAVKHFIIAANLGDEDSMKELWKHYSAGNITKEDLDATLRTHQAAINAMKSAQRDAAEAVRKN